MNYQVEGTLGRKVRDGLKNVNVVVGDKLETVTINMEIHSVEGFSGHSDHKQLIAYLAYINPKPRRVILNHGEPQAIRALENSIKKKLRGTRLPADVEIYAPRILDSISLVT